MDGGAGSVVTARRVLSASSAPSATSTVPTSRVSGSGKAIARAASSEYAPGPTRATANGGDVRPDVSGSATTLIPTKGLQIAPFSAPAEWFSREQNGQG